MKRFHFSWSFLAAGALVFGSLGLNGSIGVVATFADDREIVSATSESEVADAESVINAAESSPVDENSKNSDLRAENRNVHKSQTMRTINAAPEAAQQLLGVRLSKDGLLSGRLNLTDSVSGISIPAEKLTIKFVQRGSILTEVKPGPGGVFQVDRLLPGVVTMVATGPDGLFATSIVLYAPEDVPAGAESKVASTTLQIDATVVHPSNVDVVKKLIKGRSDATISKSMRPQVLKARHRVDGPSLPTNTLTTPVLNVGNDGVVRARVNTVDQATGERVPAVGATIYLIQRGAVRGRSVVDQQGSFTARNLVPGPYTALAIAENGRLASASAGRSYAAVGVMVELGGGNPNSGTVNKSSRLSVMPVKAEKLDDNSNSFSIDTAPGSDVEAGLSSSGTDGTADASPPAPDANTAGNAAGTTGSSGGTGSPGGTGLAGVGLIGAVAGGVAAGVAGSQNNNSAPASPK